MTTDPHRTEGVEALLNWRDTLHLMKRVLKRHLQADEQREVEDLAQEAAIRLLRATRRGAVERVEGLASDIARKTAIDYIRTQARWRLLIRHTADPADSEASLSTATPPGDPLDRFRFVVLEYFRGSDQDCEDLARVYFEDAETWNDVAGRLGMTPAAVRQRWSRCMGSLRDRIRRDPDFLDGIEMEI